MNTNGDTDMVGILDTAYPTPHLHYLLSACCMFTNGIANMAGVITYDSCYIMPFSYHYDADITMTFGFAKWLLTIVSKWANKQDCGAPLVTILPTSIVHQSH